MEQSFLRIFALVAVLAFLAGSATTFALMHWTQRIPNLATLKVVGIGVYEDPGCTVSVAQIEWGMVEPEDRATFDTYIKNESNVPITLTIYTEDWSPANASNFISLSWDYNGSEILVDDSIPVAFVLNVDPATAGIDSFSFTIVIVGSG
jgi:hypothetical protein